MCEHEDYPCCGCDADDVYNDSDVCPDCGEMIIGCVCEFIPHDDWNDDDYEIDQFRDDVEADADVLRMAGWGTDEDYGYYGDNE